MGCARGFPGICRSLAQKPSTEPGVESAPRRQGGAQVWICMAGVSVAMAGHGQTDTKHGHGRARTGTQTGSVAMAGHGQIHCRSCPALPQQSRLQGQPGEEQGQGQDQEGLEGTALAIRLHIWHGLHISEWPEYEEQFQPGDFVYCSFQDSASLGTISPSLFKVRNM